MEVEVRGGQKAGYKLSRLFFSGVTEGKAYLPVRWRLTSAVIPREHMVESRRFNPIIKEDEW